MNESGLETQERYYHEVSPNIDLKDYFDKVQELLKLDPDYTKWLEELDERNNHNSR